MQIKRIIYTGCLLLFVWTTGFAQKETWNWVFGANAGLTFKSEQLRSFNGTGMNIPDAILSDLPGTFSSSMSNLEGVFSISDKDGNLLFYSNGMGIWKADGTSIYAALGGHSSSAQSGIVIPYPGDNNKYICVGLGEKADNRMNYVIVQANSPTDVSVIGNLKTFSGHTGLLGESMSAVKHANGEDWWIVAPGKSTQLGSTVYMNAWLLTASGVENSVPRKTTNTGLYISANSANGYLKFTLDGKYFVYPTYNQDLIYGEFDNQTGEFLNIRSIEGGRYGAEFSPNQKYLYLTSTDNNDPYNGLFVWDFEALLQGTTTTPIKQLHLNLPGALQLDPFGRIWGIYPSGRDMFLIENPNEPNSLKVYKLIDFLLPGTIARYGLPSFSASWFYLPIKGADDFCMHETQTYTFKVSKGTGFYELSHTEWDFGDGTVVLDTNFGEQTQSHTYTKQGSYTITVRCIKTDGSEATNQRQRLKIRVKSCRLPVNHNISTMSIDG
ncbi:PKD domain-containing protein [Parabacteroides sp. PF5-9]|uniref:PKD domain-containing protein n=1 Tax=Parabacteroides sp. PF5-9 TaxID=1742404 RepID=UPI0024739228|nr:PKD domain-containing protein [Parabacteroides sp. PF5-9]MDH6357557.1 hypothetical protein [Parabacteroides sp. PF5-9]